jgi:hypothetical protein
MSQLDQQLARKKQLQEELEQRQLKQLQANYENFFRGYTPAEGINQRQHREFSKKYLDTLEESLKIQKLKEQKENPK